MENNSNMTLILNKSKRIDLECWKSSTMFWFLLRMWKQMSKLDNKIKILLWSILNIARKILLLWTIRRKLRHWNEAITKLVNTRVSNIQGLIHRSTQILKSFPSLPYWKVAEYNSRRLESIRDVDISNCDDFNRLVRYRSCCGCTDL